MKLGGPELFVMWIVLLAVFQLAADTMENAMPVMPVCIELFL